jgi:hypothetical protein
MTGNGGLIAEEGLAEEMFLPVEGTLAMSVAGGRIAAPRHFWINCLEPLHA